MTSLNLRLLQASARSWFAPDGKRVGPYWLQWLWSALFAVTLAAAFTLLGFVVHAAHIADWTNPATWWFYYSRNLVLCATIAAVIHALFDLLLTGLGLGGRVNQWPMWRRSLFFAGVPMLGVAIGAPLGLFLLGADRWHWLPQTWGQRAAISVIGWVAISTLIAFALHNYFSAKALQYEAEKRATEAQLRLLQAQIEPHFLFNTLANVHTLIDADAPKAKRMLEAFIDYLRGSLTNLRRDDSTLEHELGMAETYLKLMQTRMDERLSFSVDVADATLRKVALPPLLLQPLVENAIHHGLEPCVDGGHVTVSARVQDQQLVLSVEDNGMGLQAPQRRAGPLDNGVALDNIRARLASRYGEPASLTLEANESRGARATIRLPLDSAV